MRNSIKAKLAGETAARRMNDRAFKAYSESSYDILEVESGLFSICFQNSTETVRDDLSFDEVESFFEG